MKRDSSSLIIRKIENKTVMRPHLIPIRLAIIKKLKDNNISKDVRKGGPQLRKCILVQ
jgi:hypothetical protein